MNAYDATRYIARLIIILLALLLVLLLADLAGALGMDIRADACRTYHIHAHTGGLEEVDGKHCGDDKPARVHLETAENAVSTVDTVDTVDDGGETIPDNTPTAGNPGNTKPTGNAGEDPNGRGTMPNDNAGGNGNGEHGNQGDGGQQ